MGHFDLLHHYRTLKFSTVLLLKNGGENTGGERTVVENPSEKKTGAEDA